MKERDRNTGPEPIDSRLAARFAQLREDESGDAPDFVADNINALPRPEATGARRVPHYFGRIAAALALAGVVTAIVVQRPAEDPAALYTKIMQEQILQTDGLLLVSDSILPEMGGLPGLYDIDLEIGNYRN